MSFILDALRKSEHDRQRQTGPGLAEVAIARPTGRGNLWAGIAVALLVLNVLALGAWLFSKGLRKDDTPAPAAVATGPAMPTTTMTGTVPRPAPSPPPPQMQPAIEAAPADPLAGNPLADEVGSDFADGAAGLPQTPPATSSDVVPTGGGRVVYETAPLTPDSTPTSSAPQAPAGKLPTFDDIAAQAGVPALNLDIHVFGTRQDDRFVFINGRKYREGETLQEGPQVESITAEGVVLNYRGNRFLLARP